MGENLKGLKELVEEISDFGSEIRSEEKETNLRVCERIIEKQDKEVSAIEKEFLA